MQPAKDNEAKAEKELVTTTTTITAAAAEEDATVEDDMDVEEVDSDEWDDDFDNPIANHDCIFCAHHSEDLVENVKHMSVVHSFFIPDTEYIIDLEGLLLYLGEKIARGMCEIIKTKQHLLISITTFSDFRPFFFLVLQISCASGVMTVAEHSIHWMRYESIWPTRAIVKCCTKVLHWLNIPNSTITAQVIRIM